MNKMRAECEQLVSLVTGKVDRCRLVRGADQ